MYTYRTENIRGFWAGMKLKSAMRGKQENPELTRTCSGTFNPLVSITFSRALGFSIYRKAKYTFDGWIESVTGRSPLQHVNKPGTYPDMSTLACFTGAGMVSGGVTAFALST